MPETEGRTLSEADIAAAVESAPSVPSGSADDADAAIADVQALIGGAPDPDEAGDGAGEELAGQAGESPAGEPGGQAKPAEKPEDGKQAGGGEQTPAVVPVWDPERQRRDQERANQDKAKDREIADLKAQLAAKPAEKPAEKDAKRDTKAEVNLKSLKDKVKTLTSSDETTTEDWAGVFSATIDEMERLASRNQDSSDVAELKAQIASMAAKQQQDEVKRADSERDAGLKAAQKQVLDEMEALDRKYHPQMRNEAVALANQMLKDEGHSEDSPATASEWKLALKASYAEVAGKHPELLAAKPARKAAPRQAVRPDPGTGGGHQSAPRGGRIADVGADMLKSGKFR